MWPLVLLAQLRVGRIIQLGSAASVSGIAVSAFRNRPSELCRADANLFNKEKLLPEVSKVVRVLDCGFRLPSCGGD